MDVRKQIIKAVVTGWQTNPYIRGAYSYARPGHAARRRDMVAADTGNVAFAGEAFSLNGQTSAHGAYQSGGAWHHAWWTASSWPDSESRP
jgi:monoamine oxidase